LIALTGYGILDGTPPKRDVVMQGKSEGSTEAKDADGIGPDVSFLKQTWGSVAKAVLGSFTAMIFGVVILMASIMAATDPSSVYPHTTVADTGDGVQAIEVEYYLPYPGVLPDSPLYKVKAVRDRMVLWVTRGEKAKAEKELLYADKRINAAMFLVEGGKEALGVTTATKAEKYLESATNRTVKLAEQEKDVKSLLNTLVTATLKHMELIESLKKQASGERIQALERAWEGTKVVHERAEQALLESS